MATVLPPVRDDISGTAPNPSNALARTAFGVLHDYLINLLGSAGTPAAARTALGSTATGDSLFTTATAATARTTLGATTVGDAVFIASSAQTAEDALGVTRSLAATGYRKTGDGLIEQWGTTTGTTGAASSITVTFPIAFPTAAYTVTAINGDTGATLGTVLVNALTTTNFNATFVIGASGVGTGVAVRVNWIAKGK